MRILSLPLIALFFWFSFPGFAQQCVVPAHVKLLAATAHSTDRRITLDIVVTDRSRKPVPGLQQQDFTLLDNQKPQTILSFCATDNTLQAAAPPLQAVVLVDALNVQFQSVTYQRQQLAEFLRKDGGKLPLPISVVVFSEKDQGQAAFTRDGMALADFLSSKQFGLRAFQDSQGSYGDVERAQLSLGTLERFISDQGNSPGRKLLIWLGPGWPLASGPEVQLSGKDRGLLFGAIVSLSAALREAGITLYNIDPLEAHLIAGQRYIRDPNGVPDAVGLSSDYESFVKGVDSAKKVQNGNLALQVLALQSGGQVLNRNNGIPDSMASCLMDATVYYTLTFDSSVAGQPNEYHKIQVKLSKPGLTARTRAGYYAQP